jgi:hypothetical protein
VCVLDKLLTSINTRHQASHKREAEKSIVGKHGVSLCSGQRGSADALYKT